MSSCSTCGGSGVLLYDNPEILRKIKGWGSLEPMPSLTKTEAGLPMKGYMDFCLMCNAEKLRAGL